MSLKDATPEQLVATFIVRLHCDDDNTEDHSLKNGVHFADYIRRMGVPESRLAFDLHGRQVATLSSTQSGRTRSR
jgi:hypothetical protein